MQETLLVQDAPYITELCAIEVCVKAVVGICCVTVTDKALVIYYSKIAMDQLFDIGYFTPIANDTPVGGPHYCVLKLSICHVQLALIIFNSLKSIFILTTNTQK